MEYGVLRVVRVKDQIPSVFTTNLCHNFRVYNIGIEVRQGRGRYRDTNIVTFSPRYQLDNRSSHKLAFAQKYMADRQQVRGVFFKLS